MSGTVYTHAPLQWEGTVEDLLRRLDGAAVWNAGAAPCVCCGYAAQVIRQLQGQLEESRRQTQARVAQSCELLADVRDYLRHHRRNDMCQCDVCKPVNGLIGRIDAEREGANEATTNTAAAVSAAVAGGDPR